MDRMLHRGTYLIKDEYKVVSALREKGWRAAGHGPGIPLPSDIASNLYAPPDVWTFSGVVVFIIGTVSSDPDDRQRGLDGLLEDLRHDLPGRLHSCGSSSGSRRAGFITCGA